MCTVIRQDASLGSIASIVLRGSSESFLDDVERAIDDGVNAYKVRVCGGGWLENGRCIGCLWGM